MHRHPYPIPLISFTIHEFMCQPHKQTIEIDESKVRNGDIRQWSLEFEWFRVIRMNGHIYFNQPWWRIVSNTQFIHTTAASRCSVIVYDNSETYIDCVHMLLVRSVVERRNSIVSFFVLNDLLLYARLSQFMNLWCNFVSFIFECWWWHRTDWHAMRVAIRRE